jgi:hypothetical protein
LPIDTQEYISRYGRRPSGQRLSDNAAVFRRSPGYLNRYGNAPQSRGVRIQVKNLDTLNAALDHYVDRAQEAVRPSAYAMARVLYDETKNNVDRVTGQALYGVPRGVLKDSIYHVFSKDNSTTDQGGMRAVYHVSWNHAKNKAPHGHLVEFGHWMPYVTRLNRKTGRYYTVVKPSMLAEYRMKYQGRTVPPGERDKYFVRRPGGPKWIHERPFLRSTMSSFPAALAAGKKRFADFMNQVQLPLPL